MNSDRKEMEKELSDLNKKLGTIEDFDDFVDKLQMYIDKEEEELYSEIVRNEYRNPTNVGAIEHNNGTAKMNSDCGDTMQFDLLVENEMISDVKFTATCGVTTATGSMLSKLIKGKKIDEALKFTAKHLVNALDGLPQENLHAAGLAIRTLKSAIKNYEKNK
jgi:NifU-like protein involved in Fe-S cluster formation